MGRTVCIHLLVLGVLLLGFAEAQFNSTACSASQAAPVDSSVLPWGGTGLKIFNDIAKQTTVAVLETEPGLGTALGIVATLLWPTPSQSNSSVPAYAIQQCALQYAVNQALILATSNSIASAIASTKSNIDGALSELKQGNYASAVTFLQTALTWASSASNDIFSANWSTQNNSFVPQSVTPLALQAMAVHLVLLREFVVNGLPVSETSQVAVYDSTPAVAMLCTYQRYMAFFNESWNYFVAQRANTITVSAPYEVNAPGPDAKYRLVNITDSSSGTFKRAGGAFCTNGLSCNGGEAPTAAVQAFGDGTKLAMYNDAVAMYALSLEPLSFMHQLVPQLADQPVNTQLPWMMATLTRGPYTMNPSQQDVTVDSIIGLPNYNGVGLSYAFPFEIAIGELSLSNRGAAGVTLTSQGSCSRGAIPNSFNNFVSSATFKFEASDFIAQPTNFQNYPVGVTLASMMVGTSVCKAGNCTAGPTISVNPPTAISLQSSRTVSASVSPDWFMSLGQLVGVTPLLDQNIGSCASCQPISTVVGIQANFRRRTATPQLFTCRDSDAPLGTTYESILPWYWREFEWTPQLLAASVGLSQVCCRGRGAASLSHSDSTQTPGVDLARVVRATIRPGRASAFQQIVLHSGAVVDARVLRALFFAGENCQQIPIFTPLYRALAATATYTALYLNPNSTQLFSSNVTYASLLASATAQMVVARNLTAASTNSTIALQSIALAVPLASLELALRREQYIVAPTTANQDALVTAFGFYTNYFELAVPQWESWRAAQFVSSASGTSWSARDTMNGTARSGTASSTTLASNYASGTHDVMRNEAESFLAFLLTPVAGLGQMVQGLESQSNPVSWTVTRNFTRGPYASALSVEFSSIEQYALVGLPATSWDTPANATAFSVTEGNGATPAVSSLQALYGPNGAGAIGGTRSGLAVVLTGPSAGINSVLGQFDPTTGPSLRYVSLASGTSAGTAGGVGLNNTVFNATLGSAFRLVSAGYATVPGAIGVSAFGARFRLNYAPRPANSTFATTTFAGGAALQQCQFLAGGLCSTAQPCCDSTAVCARHTVGVCNGTATTELRCTAPGGFATAPHTSNNGVVMVLFDCSLLIVNTNPAPVGLVRLRVVGPVTTSRTGCTPIVGGTGGVLCQLGQLAPNQRIVVPLQPSVRPAAIQVNLIDLGSNFRLSIVDVAGVCA